MTALLRRFGREQGSARIAELERFLVLEEDAALATS
jgi:hypothetical protein